MAKGNGNDFINGYQETGSVSFSALTPEYLTFTLDNPYVMAAGDSYGVAVNFISDPNNWNLKVGGAAQWKPTGGSAAFNLT